MLATWKEIIDLSFVDNINYGSRRDDRKAFWGILSKENLENLK
jgi:hypothetical protein